MRTFSGKINTRKFEACYESLDVLSYLFFEQMIYDIHIFSIRKALSRHEL
jgi:hypothetical protein